MKKSMKRVLELVMVCAICISLLACSSGNGEPEETKGSQTEGTEASKEEKSDDGKEAYKVGFANVWVGNSWGVQCVNELESYLKNNDKVEQYYITDANNDTNKQISDIEDLISKDIDLLLLQPISPDAVAPVVEKAKEKGIVVVTCASPVGTDQYDASVLAKDEDFGRAGMEWLCKELNGKGKIIMLNGMSGVTVSENRTNGAKEVLKDYPDIEIVGEEYGDWDYAKGKTAAENLLAANPEIDGVWSQGGEMTRGAMEAFMAAGRDLVPMTGEDSNGFLKMWKEYKPDGFKAIATSMPTWLFAEGAETGLGILEGNVPEEKDIVVDIPVITDDELEEYVREDLSDSFWAGTRMPEDDITALYGADKDGTSGFGGSK